MQFADNVGLIVSAYRINGYCSICRRTENVLIGLHGCARSSGPALFAYDIKLFSPVVNQVRKNVFKVI